MSFELLVPNQPALRVALTGRSARLVRGTSQDFLDNPGEVLQRLQASDPDTITALLTVAVPSGTDITTLLDSLPGAIWADVAASLFEEVLSFFQPEKRETMRRFLQTLSDRRQALLDQITQQIGGGSASNSSERPESTSTTGPSETSTASPSVAAEPSGNELPA